jgi:hypothetical protein
VRVFGLPFSLNFYFHNSAVNVTFHISEAELDVSNFLHI